MFGIKFNQCNLFIGFYSLYLTLNAYKVTAFTTSLRLLIILISFGYFLYVIFNMRQVKLLKCIGIMFFIFAAYGLIYMFFGDALYMFNGDIISRADYFKSICASLLPVFPFYYFTRKGQLTSNVIMQWLPIFLLIASFEFYRYYQSRVERALSHGYRRTEFTNNIGYTFVSILPILFLKQKKVLLQFIYIGVASFFIVTSAKRGAIITGGLALCYYLYHVLYKGQKRERLKYILVGLVVISIAGYYISGYIENSLYFQKRLESTTNGDSSGRNIIYSALVNAFYNSNIFEIFFGHGAYSTLSFTRGLLAHNDWLEILTNHGILGVIIYFYYFYVLFKMWKHYKGNTEFGLCVGGLLISLFFASLYSMSYYRLNLYSCIALGYCSGRIFEFEHTNYGNRITR